MAVKPIVIIGCGPGGADYITPVAREWVGKAAVVAGTARLMEAFPEARSQRIPVGSDIPGALDAIQANLNAGAQPIVVLVTGDPGLCSLARPVIRRFGRELCRVIPGISSVQAAFAAVGCDWLGASVLSAHDGIPAEGPSIAVDKVAILAGNPATEAWVIATARDFRDTHRVFVCRDLTLPEEAVQELDFSQVPSLRRSIVLMIRKELLK